jgi:hypothetical protein
LLAFDNYFNIVREAYYFTYKGGNLMRRCLYITFLSFVFSFIFFSPLSYSSSEKSGAETSNGKTYDNHRTTKKKKPHSLLISYNPPSDPGRPTFRYTLDNRSPEEKELPFFSLLVPEHRGKTTQAQPILYWYIEHPTSVSAEFVLHDGKNPEPLIEKKLDLSKAQGIQQINVSDFNKRLEPDREYEWSIALIPDPDHRSNDLVEITGIKRESPSENLEGSLEKADEIESAALYAGQGFWYDALSTLSALIDAAPYDRNLHQMRIMLLESGGLINAVEYYK